MYIESINFSKTSTKENSKGWRINNCNLNKINLITGKNASGKTRLVKAIDTLVKCIYDDNVSLNDGFNYEWDISLKNDSSLINYKLVCQDNLIINENLIIDGTEYLTRNDKGVGEISFELVDNKKFEFEIENTKIAIYAKRDKKQHPTLELIFDWVSSVYMYSFGSTLGRNTLMASNSTIDDERMMKQVSKDDFAVVFKYQKGILTDGFKKNIINDINSLGYSLSDIGTTKDHLLTDKIDKSMPIPSLLYIKESGVQDIIYQHEISQGMFRVISLIIQIRYLELTSNYSPCIIIDDIGEGLDFERSTKLIKYIVQKAEELQDNVQIIMTTNDRFVMNTVDLDYWIVVEKDKELINFYNSSNNSERIEDFKMIGLNNFDFFTNEFYKDGK